MRSLFLLLLPLLVAAPLRAQTPVTMTIDAAQRGPLISDHQYGLFFEEINHAGDGGLYAEMVQNRSFDSDLDAWTAYNGSEISLYTANMLNDMQTHALRVGISGASADNPVGVTNSGYWGMAIRQDSTYAVSLWVRTSSTGFNGRLSAQLQSSTGADLGSATLQGELTRNTWTQLTATIQATGSDDAGRLAILSTYNGTLYIDVVSLFPRTWKGRPNGLRPDLAQLLADTKPTFLRFPGGCFVEGYGSYDNAFQWKRTIGPIEERPGHWNGNWGYWSTDGLGFDEYLQLCEDLGADPLFVVNVGLGHYYTIDVNELDTLVQDALDAIEYANGDATTEWGAKRIANGHAEPYGLKYIEIGNENYQDNASDQSADYAERYLMFYNAIKAAYPDIQTIGNVESWGTDTPSWRNEHPVEMVDEHYYRSQEWMIANYNKYDTYSRAIPVYNGEYAANSGSYGTNGNMSSALGEAVYMMGMERNSDVCQMASFAPIFTHENNRTWAYDMIHFTASESFVTPSYYVQKLMAENLGKQNLLWTETGNSNLSSEGTRVGVGTWATQAVFSDFSIAPSWTLGTGTWTESDGTLTQTSSADNCTAIADTLLTGDYSLKVRAQKTGGNEGFLVIFNYQDADNYVWWNLGGWSNTTHGVEQCVNGTKTTVASCGGSITTGQWYDIEVRVNGSQVTCLLDDAVVHEFTLPSSQAIYQSVQIDEESNMLTVKVANPNAQAASLQLNLQNMTPLAGSAILLGGGSDTDENTLESPNLVVPTTATISIANGEVEPLEILPYSLYIFNIEVSDIAAEETTSYAAYEEEDADKVAYLYAHMHASEEHTCYATSLYGQVWTDMFDGDEVFATADYTVTGGMRDAFLYRLHDGGFILCGTDMTSALGWTSNHIMDIMLTPDLVHWTKSLQIDLHDSENLAALGVSSASDITAAWAPQIIYDPETETYVLYYTVGFSDRHRIFYQQIDRDLNLLTEPRLYYAPELDIIDADIVWNAVDEQYQMIYKNEEASGLLRATADHLVPATDDEATDTRQWTQTQGFLISDSGQSIEAPTQWRPIGETTWNTSYMNYSGSGYGYKTRRMDEHGLQPGDAKTISGDVYAQHGSILKITQAELDYLQTWEQVVELLPQVKVYAEESADSDIEAAVAQAESALSTSTTFEENAAAMTAALEALQQAATSYSEWLRNNPEEAETLTSLIVNADFSQGSTGWTTSVSFTQADGNVAEFWNTNFNFYQTITDLPAGVYLVTVQSFFRQGTRADALSAHNAGTESLDAIFYANTDSVAVLSLYDESASGYYTQSPNTYPDNVSDANTAFNTNGLYVNQLTVVLEEEGDLTIGICCDNYTASDWCCFDNFTLTYLGTADGVEAPDVQRTYSDATYNLSGQRVGANTRGIVISNGEKILRR